MHHHDKTFFLHHQRIPHAPFFSPPGPEVAGEAVSAYLRVGHPAAALACAASCNGGREAWRRLLLGGCRIKHLMSVRVGLDEMRRRGYHLDARCFRWLRRLYQGSHKAVPGDPACASWLQRLWKQFSRPSATHLKLLVDVSSVLPARQAGAWLSGTTPHDHRH